MMFSSKLRVPLEDMAGDTRMTLGFPWWLVLLIGGIASDETNKASARMEFESIIQGSKPCR